MRAVRRWRLELHMNSPLPLNILMDEARACRVCEPHLPRGCRPLVWGSQASRVLLISQAPGAAAHESGVPWDDRSGDRLRGWLGLSPEEFYDPSLVGILPMGFCYPGKGKNGDLKPRPECAPAWHPRLLRGFESVRLTIFIGRCAFERYLSEECGSLTEAVRANERWLPERAAMPHPSPRNNIWLKKHPWFQSEVVPVVREAVRHAVGGRN